MLKNNFSFKIFALLWAFIVPFTWAADDPGENELGAYEDFVARLGNDIIKILVNKSAPMEDRKQEFRGVLQSNFDIPSIGKFVLARYWRQASDAQKKEYLELFEDAIVDNYAAQFDNYNNETLNVESARRARDGGVIIVSKIVRHGNTPPLQVDWKVFNTKAGMRVLDIVVNGVSMSISQRSEYASAIKSKGGIDGLLAAMRNKEVTIK